jgi:hypothetical protein
MNLAPSLCISRFTWATPEHLYGGPVLAAIGAHTPNRKTARKRDPLPEPTRPTCLASTCNDIKNQAPAAAKIFSGTLQSGMHACGRCQVIQRVEHTGNQIDWPRQTQLSQILLQKADIGACQFAARLRQHRSRAVHPVKYIAELCEMAKEGSGAAADIGGRGKAEVVAAAAPLEAPLDHRRCGVAHDPVIELGEPLIR